MSMATEAFTVRADAEIVKRLDLLAAQGRTQNVGKPAAVFVWAGFWLGLVVNNLDFGQIWLFPQNPYKY